MKLPVRGVQQIYNALGILPLTLVILALVVILSAIFLLVPRGPVEQNAV